MCCLPSGKKGTPRLRSQIGLADLGVGSVASAGTFACSAFGNGGAESDEAGLDEFCGHVDNLHEKRRSTRENALEQLAVSLRVSYRADDCFYHLDTLMSRCVASMKKGSAVECSLACQVIGLIVLTMARADESLFGSLRPELERACLSGLGQEVQGAAVEALCVAAFVLLEDEHELRGVLRYVQGLWPRVAGPVAKAAALRGWALLLTTAPAVHLGQWGSGSGSAGEVLRQLAHALHDRDEEARAAAGEAAALVCEAVGGRGALLDLDGMEEGGSGKAVANADGQASWEACSGDGFDDLDDDDDDDNGGDGGSAAHAGWAAASDARASRGNGRAPMDDVVDRMRELASNRGDRRARKRRERASTRSTFRGLLSAVEGAGVPRCRVQLVHGDALVVEGRLASVQLSFMRRLLAGGFQAHMQSNPLLHDVFGFAPRAARAEKLTAQEKRALLSASCASAKARTAGRKCDRQAKALWQEQYGQ